jgi:hypothetical protein
MWVCRRRNFIAFDGYYIPTEASFMAAIHTSREALQIFLQIFNKEISQVLYMRQQLLAFPPCLAPLLFLNQFCEGATTG